MKIEFDIYTEPSILRRFATFLIAIAEEEEARRKHRDDRETGRGYAGSCTDSDINVVSKL